MNKSALRSLCLVLLLTVAAAAVSGQANPFTGQSGGASDSSRPETRVTTTSPDSFAEFGPPRTALGAWLRRVQRELTNDLARMLREVQRGDASGTFWLIMSISFIYGVVHSLLPGHRKVLLFSYFMAHPSRPVIGVVAGTLLAVVHASAAVIVVMVAYFVIRSSVSVAVTQVSSTVQITTAGVLLLTGIILTIIKVREAMSHDHQHSHGHGHDQSHDHDPSHHSTQRNEQQSRLGNRLLPVIIISGIVPCPGSSMILLFAISLGAMSLGLLAVGAFAVGMAISLSFLSVATILIKTRITGALNGPRGHMMHHVIEIGSAIFMVAFGAFLFLPVFL